MEGTTVSKSIGRGVQLFRVRNPQRHFVELAELDPMTEHFVGRRRVWKARDEDAWYALLTICYKDEEEILVRGPNGKWDSWDWPALVAKADGCRWKGPDRNPRHVL